MYRITTLLLICFAIHSSMGAQYQTPNTGVHFDMDDLVGFSGGTVTGSSANGYIFHDDFILSETDTLSMAGDLVVVVGSSDVSLEIYGTAFLGESGAETLFMPFVAAEPYEGIRFESTSHVRIYDIVFDGGGGLKVLTEDFEMYGTEVSNQQHIATNNAALEFSSGMPVVQGCYFFDNQGSAISSAANIPCSPQISACAFINNNTENTNRPQVNLGPSLPDVPTLLVNLVITSDGLYDQVGGIACASFFGNESTFIFHSGQVVGNRYGITVQGGNITTVIYNNLFLDNNIQGEPMLGGSGINLFGGNSCEALIYDNVISGNLWGITVQNDFQVDMGNPDITADSPGNNTFSNNGNGGVTYALYNNTPSPIPAINNCWIAGQESTVQEIEAVIFHVADEDGLGEVDFSFAQCAVPSSIGEFSQREMSLFPNPSKGVVQFEGELPMHYMIYDITGAQVKDDSPSTAQIDLSDLSEGIYTIMATYSDGSRGTIRLVLE